MVSLLERMVKEPRDQGMFAVDFALRTKARRSFSSLKAVVNKKPSAGGAGTCEGHM
jgi:hypothetical protein